MPVREQPHQDELEGVALADDGALDLVEDPRRVLLDLGELHQSALQCSDGPPQRGDLDAGGEVLARHLAIAADDLPGVVAEHPPRGVGLPVEVDPAARRQKLGRDPRRRRPQPVVEVEGGREAERDLALHALELGDPLRRTRARAQRRVERGRHARREGGTQSR